MKPLNYLKKLSLCAIMSMLSPMIAHAFNNDELCVEVDGIWYSLSDYDYKAEVISNRKMLGYTGSIVIPDIVEYQGVSFSVTSISLDAFKGCTGLTSVTIPNSVSSVLGNALFKGCTNLVSVSLSNSMRYISSEMFEDCISLTSVTIPNGIEMICQYAFRGCTSLAYLTIPSSVTEIFIDAFENCSSLASIVIDKDNPIYDSRDNCNAIIETNSNKLLLGCKNTVIPNSVIAIGKLAFHRCSGLTSLTIPKSVTDINISAFWKCVGLTSIVVEEGNIKYDSRNHCNAIIDTESNTLVIGCMNTTIPNSVKRIGDYAFYECSNLKSVVLPNGLQEIGIGAFEGCEKLETVIIPNTVKDIGFDAFADCLSLYSVTSLINMPFILSATVFGCYTGNYDTNIIYMAATLYVPRGRVTMYSNVGGWKNFLNILETDTKFKLTYMVDGTEYKNYEIQATEVITPEPDPVKDGYIFSGWSEIPYLMPAQNVTVTGYFKLDPNYSGIEDNIEGENITKSYYSIDGKCLNKSRKGLNIVREEDGTVRKVIVK